MVTYATLAKRSKADVIIVPCLENTSLKDFCEDAKDLPSCVSLPLETKDFRGKKGEVLFVYPEGSLEPRVCLLGLGKKVSVEALREGYAKAVRKCLAIPCKTANVFFPKKQMEKEELEAAFEGLLLGNYVFSNYKSHHTKDIPQLIEHFSLVTQTSSPALNPILEKVSSVHFTRDLVNTNAEQMTPLKLASIAIDMGKKRSHLDVEVLDKKQMQDLGMGLFLAVNQGSTKEPKLIIFSYKGDPSSPHNTAFVGKGVTYDTGGLSLKPTQFMNGMKADMGGAATVFGLIDAASRLQIKKNILGVIPTTENSIGPDSYRVGDVFTSYSGKTVEIDNTDAEGRLILADALSYTAKKYKPDLMIDLATLTGAIVVALGEEYSGLFSNNLPLREALEKAAVHTGEGLWPMPLHRPYFSLLKSDFADTKNSGSREAGSITAALFLREFIEDLPWAHIDIAGAAFRSREVGCDPKHGTGQIVRTLLSFLELLDNKTLKEIKSYET